MKNITRHFQTALAAGFCWLMLLAVSASAATTYNWTGTSADNTFDTAGNWSPSGPPSGVNGDTAQWNGTQAGSLSLTWAGTANDAAPGIYLSLLAGQTGSVTLDGATTAGMRLQGITLASGAGALTFGNGVGTRGAASGFAVTINGASFACANSSANTVIFNTDVGFGSSGGSAQKLVLTGNWTFHNNLAPTGSGSISFVVNSGTMNYDGVSTAFPNSTLIAAGTLASSTGVINFNSGATLVAGGNTPIEAGTAGFGTINMISGSSIVPGQFLVAGITTSGAVGIWNISGGTFSTSGNNGGTLGATAGCYGQLNMTGTGSYVSTDATANGFSGIFVGENGTGYLNISGSATMSLGGAATSSGLIIGGNNG